MVTMLIEFSVTNFRSFRERQTLSMVGASFQDHLETNTFDAGVPGFNRVLRSAALYGANAAGKTNLLRALQFMQNLIVNSAGTAPGNPIAYTPFRLSKAAILQPSEFEITFIQKGVRYEYGFSLDESLIHTEWLVEYATSKGRTLFERIYDKRAKKHRWKLSDFLRGKRSVWTHSTRPEALFLSTAIQLNNTQLIPVYEWFQKTLVVVVGITAFNQGLTFGLFDAPNGKQKLLRFLQEADLGIAGIDLIRETLPTGAAGGGVFLGQGFIEQKPGNVPPNLIRITVSHQTDGNDAIGFDFSDESSGTQILFNSAGAWLNVLANGEVLLFDEIDKSLHPKLTRFLIDHFHSNNTNSRNAQLIFTTHNTSLLDLEIFRRDQIWFVSKQKDLSSNVYPLTDFKPRNDEIIEKWYMRGKYGAVPFIENSKK